jgi:hypothetical protein
MSLRGEGTCTIDLTYGDGNTQQVSVQLPHTLTHVYSEPRAYNVTAAAVPPCAGGRHTARLEITPGPVAPRLTAISVTPDAAGGRRRGVIEVTGTGSCSYLLDYGDGNRERRTVTLPDRVDHVFPATGAFTVVATAEPPCEGSVREVFREGRARTSIARLVISPNPALPQSRVSFAIEGRGTCTVRVRFGDGAEESVEGALPLRVSHRYARPGRYEVFAWAAAPCTGDASGEVQIRR